ncbi:MAG: glutaredoxin [Caldiserica bacterium]|nr:MAG: glutaredoxin [Caldisericota bacterium]
MPLLQEKDRIIVREKFEKELKDEVTILLFKKTAAGIWTPNEDEDLVCRYCKETEELYKEVTELSDLLKLEAYTIEDNKEKFDEYKVERIPTVVIKGHNKGLIRFVGIPAGYEFATLLEDLIDASRDKVDLKERNRRKVEAVKEPLHIQVFVTPTCPYCPRAVRIAHKMAFINENIMGDMVEASEFPNLSEKYGVYAVPKIIVNDKVEFEGALPEDQFIAQVLKAVERNN